MLSMRSAFVFILTTAVLLSVPAAGADNSHPQGNVVLATPSEVSSILAEVPEGQVVAIYENGALTIVSHNAGLSDVLRAVCSKVGAKLEMESEDREPVAGILGPGPVQQVLASLMTGSRFDYAMQSSDTDRDILARVVVVPKSRDANGRGQVAQSQVSQDPAVDSQASSAPKVLTKKEGVAQMMQLLAEAKTTVGNAGTSGMDAQGDEGSGEAGNAALGTDMGAVLEQIEARLKTADTTEEKPAPTQSPAQGNAVRLPPGRRHRH
jgi:hypothetical protein